MRYFIAMALLLFKMQIKAQELYVFSEPASNMPAKSFGIKQTGKWLQNTLSNRTEIRHTTEVMAAVNRNLMLHGDFSFSNMYSTSTRWESVRAYAKYRFLTSDGMYSHFRMAGFGALSHSRNKYVFDELSIDGDYSGAQAGIIATQLLHKLAISTTVSYTELMGKRRKELNGHTSLPFQALGYTVSAGYLILPRVYKSYQQTNLNIYAELIGQRALDKAGYYVDLAPAMQLIFNSESKLNFGYRFQLGSDLYRMSKNSWLLSFEWLFLNVLK